ncbi:unnamed protein product [Cylicostephanus goldi]|uniref:Uncharacterized protein n=1 Tax=Cylicostephanus goldi TaxID=71465 RepID=A0A3P6RFE4_CYLGO|nr:unnamed protein product [Cylicostephanus goldi]
MKIYLRLQFLVGIMNIVDMVAIIPFYLELTLAMFGVDVASLSDIKGMPYYFLLYLPILFLISCEHQE